MHRVVVGVDGSDGSRRALRFGLEWAASRDASLDAVLVHRRPTVLDIPLYGIAVAPDPDRELATKRAEGVLDQLVDREVSDARSSRVAVERIVIEGAPGPTLLLASGGADLLVVGTHGHGALHGFLVGSVSHHCVAHSACPVAVVPATQSGPGGTGPVVVGVDGSAESRSALLWAHEEASVRQVPLRVVLAFPYTDIAWAFTEAPYLPSLLPFEEVREDAVRELDRLVDDSLPTGGAVVERSVVEGDPASVLLAQGQHAGLLVVGARGLGGFRGLLLGSVSQKCVHASTVPVVVVPSPHRTGGQQAAEDPERTV